MAEKVSGNNQERCLCCGTVTEGRSFCPYCGFVQVVSMDSAGEQYNDAIRKEHRNEVVSLLKNFSISSYYYRWNEATSQLELDKSETVKLADGKDCDNRIFWSSQTFGQNRPENGQPMKLTLNYTFDSNRRQVTCQIKPVQCDDFWKIGVMIDQNLRLVVCLGNEKNCAKSVPMDLNLK